MKRFLPGRPSERPRPRPSGLPPSPPPRRLPPPPPRWAARRASARPPPCESSSPRESDGDGEVALRDDSLRRPAGCWAARLAAARPPPCGCDVLRRCSLMERLLLGQARAPGSGSGDPVPPNYGPALRKAHPQCIRQSAITDAQRRHTVPGGLHAAQTTHAQNPPRTELPPKSRKSLPTNCRCDAAHEGSPCRTRHTDLSC